jgi:chemotaxis methyl-accepting protein methylase
VEDSLLELLKYIEINTGFKCQNYKEKPLIRRLRVRMRALDLDDFSAYLDHLHRDPGEFKRLVEVLTINLSYFFRNPETFDYLRDEIIPKVKDRSQLILWSAGCAQGEEAYSLAIMAAESGILNKTIIYGTDIDQHAIDRAKTGVYSPIAVQYASADIRARYFHSAAGSYEVADNLKKSVQFLTHDIFIRPEFEACDLILCRNVLIYLDRNAQSTVLKNFFDHLKPQSYLAIGKVELLLGVPEVQLFQVVNRAEHVYARAS